MFFLNLNKFLSREKKTFLMFVSVFVWLSSVDFFYFAGIFFVFWLFSCLLLRSWKWLFCFLFSVLFHFIWCNGIFADVEIWFWFWFYCSFFTPHLLRTDMSACFLFYSIFSEADASKGDPKSGETPLHVASQVGALNAVQSILAAGVSCCCCCWTLLMHRSCFSSFLSAPYLRLCLQQKLNVSHSYF